MITWRDFTVIQERHQYLLRKAEKERLIRQVLASSNNSARQGLVSLLVALLVSPSVLLRDTKSTLL